MCDLEAARAAEAARSIDPSGARTRAHGGDVSKKATAIALVDAAVGAFGRLDILVNNAGITHAAEFLDLDEADFDRVLAVNLKSMFLCGQAAARRMVAQGNGGAIVNMSSANAVVAIPNQVPYVVSKGGINQLTKVMAISLAPHGIRVNGIGRGRSRPSLRTGGAGSEEAKRKILSRTPMGGWASRPRSRRSRRSSRPTTPRTSPARRSTRTAGGSRSTTRCRWHDAGRRGRRPRAGGSMTKRWRHAAIRGARAARMRSGPRAPVGFAADRAARGARRSAGIARLRRGAHSCRTSRRAFDRVPALVDDPRRTNRLGRPVDHAERAKVASIVVGSTPYVGSSELRDRAVRCRCVGRQAVEAPSSAPVVVRTHAEPRASTRSADAVASTSSGIARSRDGAMRSLSARVAVFDPIVPAIYADVVDAGGLMTYGVVFNDLFRRRRASSTGSQGTEPADRSARTAESKFELVINRGAATASLAIPPTCSRARIGSSTESAGPPTRSSCRQRYRGLWLSPRARAREPARQSRRTCRCQRRERSAADVVAAEPAPPSSQRIRSRDGVSPGRSSRREPPSPTCRPRRAGTRRTRRGRAASRPARTWPCAAAPAPRGR